jgi:hypothetical protein
MMLMASTYHRPGNGLVTDSIKKEKKGDDKEVRRKMTLN